MSEHLFTIAPYVAVFCFVAVSTLRLTSGREIVGQHHRGGSPIARTLLVFSWLTVVAVHIALIVTPDRFAASTRALHRLIAIEIVLLTCGLGILVGLVSSIAGRLRKAQHSGLHGADAAFLGVLVIAVISGVVTALLYRWALAWSAVTLSPYVHSLLTRQPAAQIVVALPYVVRLHILSGIALVALFPFTRPAHVLFFEIHRAVSVMLTRCSRRLRTGNSH